MGTVGAIAVAAVACSGSPTAVFAPARWPPEASLAPIPGVVIDPAAGLVYVADSGAGTDAVDLADGSVRWHTDAIATPLVAADGALFGLAEDLAGPERPPGPDAFHLARVDAGGALAFTSEAIELPGELVVGVAPQQLWITARRDGDEVVVTVRGFEAPAGPFDGGEDPYRSPEEDLVVVNDVLRFDAASGALLHGRLRERHARSFDEADWLSRDPRWRLGAPGLRSAPYAADPDTPWRLARTTTEPILVGEHLVTLAYDGATPPISDCGVADVRLVRHAGTLDVGRACAQALVVDAGLLVLAEPGTDRPDAIVVVSLESGARLGRVEIDPGTVVDVALLGDDLIVISEGSDTWWQLAIHDRTTGARRWARPVVAPRTSSEYDGA